MKKIFFLCLFPLWGFGGLFAAVTVTPLGVDYSTKEVTFHVSWIGSAANNRVWVWVDLCPVAGTTAGAFAKAVISGAAATAGSIDAATLNGRGFYVTTNPSTITATLSNATGNFNWCAYGSDFPPNMTSTNGTYTLYGTPPFTLIAADGTTTQTVDATTIATSAVTITPVTLTDETGCPGVFCIYTGSDLFIDGTHLCRQRATGAQNWEAWIKDTRDDELYRIVLMPDGNWWLAQNVKLASYNGNPVGVAISGCDKDECGRWYTHAQANGSYGGTTTGYGANVQGVCPNNWVLPVEADWKSLTSSFGTSYAVALSYLTSANCRCDSDDAWGWAITRCLHRTGWIEWGLSLYRNDFEEAIYIVCDGVAHEFGNGVFEWDREPGAAHPTRCLRRL